MGGSLVKQLKSGSMSKPKLILSVDDGCASDMRVAEIARKYKLDCTFYLPVDWHTLAYANGYEPLTYPEANTIASEFEIGSHTITHRHLTKLSLPEAEKEIIESRYILMALFDQPIKKFCYPRGYTNPEITNIVFNKASYSADRLTKGVDSEGYKLVHVHPNSGANDNRKWQDVALEHEYIHLWMHSHELDRFDMWNELEEFLYDPIS